MSLACCLSLYKDGIHLDLDNLTFKNIHTKLMYAAGFYCFYGSPELLAHPTPFELMAWFSWHVTHFIISSSLTFLCLPTKVHPWQRPTSASFRPVSLWLSLSYASGSRLVGYSVQDTKINRQWQVQVTGNSCSIPQLGKRSPLLFAIKELALQMRFLHLAFDQIAFQR